MHFQKKDLLLWMSFCGFCHGDGLAGGRPTVTIASGTIIGTKTTLPHATSAVNKYIGIPYAQSPPKRFSPPVAPPHWTKPLDATETKPACIQQFNYPKIVRERTLEIFNNPGGPPPGESENCLFVNVYTPPGTTKSSRKAVLFWIYGGDLQFGTGGLEFYDGSSFAYNQDVIVVTHNYRTNVFGFPNSPEIGSSNQNAGFLDQRAALAWTRTNIAEFGGDPTKITIFGESAGGYSVKQLIANPPKPLPFRAAIMESEAAAFTGNSTANWHTLVTLAGCGGTSSPLACMRKKSPKKIKSIIEHRMLDFAPVANQMTSTTDVRPSISSGTAAKVPILIGSNEDEGRAFAYVLGLDEPGGSLKKFLEEQFPGDRPLQKAILATFSKSTQSPYILSSEVITNSTFLCTTSMLASYAHQHGYDVWRYHFSASFPNTDTFPHAGAYHSSEIPEVFGTYPRHNQLGKATKRQIKLSEYMQRAWANFAKHPTKGPGWPAYGKTKKVGELGAKGSDGEKTIPAEQLDRICSLYAPLIDAEGL